MKKSLIVFICFFLLSACNSITKQPAAATVTPIPPTSTLDPNICFYTWATKSLPDITKELQSALTDVIPNAEGQASAYGENCTKPDHSATFGAMETDFNVVLPVPDLKDDEAIGELIEKILIVLDDFAPPRVPGPNPGILELVFTRGSENRSFRVSIEKGRELRSQGLTGAELVKAIESNK